MWKLLTTKFEANDQLEVAGSVSNVLYTRLGEKLLFTVELSRHPLFSASSHHTLWMVTLN